MNDIRARFEEIWPVPEGVCWCIVDGGYFAESTEHIPNSIRHNARIDTFTRCQETTDVYVSLVDELIESLTYAKNWVELSSEVAIIENLLRKANKTRSDKK